MVASNRTRHSRESAAAKSPLHTEEGRAGSRLVFVSDVFCSEFCCQFCKRFVESVCFVDVVLVYLKENQKSCL